MTSVGKLAFENCKSLKSVTFPSTSMTLGESAFWGCTALKTVFVPKNVTVQVNGETFGIADSSGNLVSGFVLYCEKDSTADQYAKNMKAKYPELTYKYGMPSKSGWQKDSTGLWYQNADGTYVKNSWLKIDANWYHFNARGYM